MDNSGFKLNLALVIGINDYQNGIPALGTAKQDAEAIAAILQTEYQYQVHLLTESQATAQNLQHWLETDLPEAIKQANPSRLVFYFAGHGIALNGDDGPQGYLIPQDAKLGEVSTYIPMQRVEAALTKLSCRHCLVILDCCFAGAFRWSSTRKLVPISDTIHKERFDRFIQDPAWQVITSAASDQFALDNLDLKGDRGIAKSNTNHSPFAAALMEALSGSADAYPPAKNGKPAGDGIITATELYMYLRDAVEIPTDERNQRQTPQIWCLKKHDKGEFIFLPPGHELNLPPAPSLDELEDNNPYRGLKSYETKDSALFFGRTALIDKLCDAISDRSFTVVLGASGSGKSSLVKAGLIPHLEGTQKTEPSQNRRLKPQEHPHQCKYQGWKVVTPIRPGESPLKSLNSAFRELGVANTDRLDAKTLAEVIAAWSQTHPQTKLLLVVDQLEELITLCRNEPEKQQFLETLADILNAHSQVVRLVVTLRSDFEPQLRNTPLESLWQEARLVVPAMTRDELRSAIKEPASAKVVYFESLENRGDLVEQLIDEVAGMPGALPLLSFALSELYLKLASRYLEAQNRGETVERAITWGDYDALGGVTKSLTQRADEVYEDLFKVDPAYDKTIRHVMLRMVVIGGGELARRQVPLSELEYPTEKNALVKEVIERFTNGRLLVKGEDTEGKPYVEPAHNALVRGWQRLLEWKQEEDESLFLQRRLTPAAEEWANQSQPQGVLKNVDSLLDSLDQKLDSANNWFNEVKAKLLQLRRLTPESQEQKNQQAAQFLWNANPRLDLLKQVLSSSDNWLNQLETKFIQRSVRQRRQNTIVRRSIVAGVIIILTGLTLFALNQRKTAIARQLAAQSQLIREQQFSLLPRSVLLAVEAMRRFPSLEAEQALRSSVILLPRFVTGITHEGSVSSIAFSPDGKYVASGSRDKTARVWNAATGKETIPPLQHQAEVSEVTFSPDGNYLATASEDKTARVWEISSGQEVLRLNHEDRVRTVAFSPDGKYLATSGWDIFARVWDAKTGREVIRIKQGMINGVVFSPDSKYVATAGNDNTARVWEVASGKEVTRLKHEDNVRSVAFSPDSKYLATASWDKTARIWETISGKEIINIKHEAMLSVVAFSPNGKYLVTTSGTPGGELVTNDFVTRVFETTSGREVARMPNETVVEQQVAFSSDSQYLAGVSKDARVWELTSGKEVLRLKPESWIHTVAFSPDGQYLATGSDDNSAEVWDINGGAKVLAIKHGSPLWASDLSPDGKYVATAGDDSTTRLWQTTTGREVVQMKQEKPIWSIAFSPDSNYLATGSEDKTVRVWQVNNGQEISRMTLLDRVWRIAFSPYGKYLAAASGENDTVQVWEVPSGKEVTRLKHESGVISLAFSSDGKYLATLCYGGIGGARIARVVEVTSGKEVTRLEHETKEAFPGGGYGGSNLITFSSDGKYLFMAVDLSGEVRMWEINRGKEVNRFKHKAFLRDAALSPDGKYVATAGDDSTARVWEIASGKEISRLKHEGVDIWDIAFSPDSKYLATAGEDYTARVWEIASGKEISRLQHRAVVGSVNFSPDGKYLITASTDEVVRVWSLSPEDLIADACSRLTRHLTREEWQQYLGSGIPLLDRYRKTCWSLD